MGELGGRGSSPLARGGRDPLRRLEDQIGLIPARAGRTWHSRGSGFRPGAHPRSRGADRACGPAPCGTGGSSPLARGGRRARACGTRGGGLIPARAGRTSPPRWLRPHGQAHPRSRGADARSARRRRPKRGSSPLARGGRGRRCQVEVGPRLIPARAGRTCGSAAPSSAPWAHPRSRGADDVSHLRSYAPVGSSPLARGGPALAGVSPDAVGLIPARAGRTGQTAAASAARPAHPRSRGADKDPPARSAMRSGSSPLARGGPAWPAQAAPERRLIPARAGRTEPGRPSASRRAAHPRSRGADHARVTCTLAGRGSSPLARGGLDRRRPGGQRAGLIPARAGRTIRPRRGRCARRAHPRSRGADRGVVSDREPLEGSSPLARGGQVVAELAAGSTGLIPARAGRTSSRRARARARRAHPRSRGADHACDL